MFVDEKGNYISGKGLEEQIQKIPDEIDLHVTLEDFDNLMAQMMNPAESLPQNWYALTGFSGWCRAYLTYWFSVYGKQKLPRKLKKKVYLIKKLRQKYLPEYYGK